MRLAQRLATRWTVAREVITSLRGFERPAATVAATSLALVLLEGASLTLLVPVLEAFKRGSEQRLQLVVLAIGGLILLRAAASYLNGVLAARLQLRVLLRLRESLAEAFYASRYAVLAALGGGRIVNLFSMQTERVIAGISSLVALLNAVLLLAVYGGTLVLLSWRLSLAAAALGAVAFGITAYASRRIRAHSVSLTRAEEDSSRLVLDDAAGLHVIQAYDIGPERIALHRRVNQSLYREAMGLHRWRSAVRPVTEVLYAVTLLGALLVALHLWREQLFASLPLVLAFVFVLHRLQGQYGTITEAAASLAEQEGATLNVFGFLGDLTPRAPDGSETVAAPVERISVEDVEFRYDGGQPVLRGLDLELRRGEVVAIVGASGAGKSTLVQLLARLRTPQSGRVTVDGVPLDRVARRSLARNLGIVFEDCFLFDESVEWNISLGRDVAAAALQEAIQTAGLDDLIRSLPDGRRSRVGSRGGHLSAGQRQRVALARAIVTRPQTLILDEATNALDGATEESVAQRLRHARPEGITLVIAHRLSTVLAADRILVLEGGCIMAAGRHADLLETSETYRRLVETQLIRPATDEARL
jgi:ABC-type multidrug transport system fused ATPase/permease subunit